MNINPELFNNIKNSMDGKTMKNMMGSLSNLSDDQLRTYLSAAGMGNIAPETFKQMTSNYKDMDEKDLEKVTKNASNYYNPNLMRQNSNTENDLSRSNSNSGNNLNKTNSNVSTANNNFDFSQKPQNIIEKLEYIKQEGNRNFRQGKFREACEKYYEMLNDMEYIADSEKISYKTQLEDMEITCRLNIASTKLKQEDYDLVVHECLKVLKKAENFKAHFRAGVAYYQKKSYEKAMHHLTKAKELNKEGDNELDKYLKECSYHIEKSQPKQSLEEEVTLNKTPSLEKKSSKLDTLKEIVEKEVRNKKSDDILIEEDKHNRSTEPKTKGANISTNNQIPMGMDPEKINRMQNEFDNMDDSQLNNIVGMINSMDKESIKSMMKMQGMEMSDSQIDMMRNMNPEMIKGMSRQRKTMGMGVNNINNISTNSNINEPTTSVNTQPDQLPIMPNLGNMDLNSMMKLIQDNPQIMNMMGPQMASMFGGNAPNQQVLMNSMQSIFWLMSIPGKIKDFFTSTRGILITSLILFLIISYFYNK